MFEFEEWKKLPMSNETIIYWISNYGRFKSSDCYINMRGNSDVNHKRLHKGRFLTIYTNPSNGYDYVAIGKKFYKTSRLVAEMFIPNPYKLKYVNHRYENKQNNTIWNLQWCTKSYNERYGTKKKRELETRTKNNRKNALKPVQQYTLNGEFVAEYESAAEAERQTGINKVSIHFVCRGKNSQGFKCKSAGGFIWKYKEVA